MTTTGPPLHRLIEAALARHPDPVADASPQLWRKLARELILVIGEIGFDTLYARSVRLARVRHPWIRQDVGALPTNDLFAQLQQSLQAQDDAQGKQASIALLTSKKPIIHRLASGVHGLDELLGGGIPEFSFNLIAGTPGIFLHRFARVLRGKQRRKS